VSFVCSGKSTRLREVEEAENMIEGEKNWLLSK